jgi:hypothetical protein
MLIQVADDHIVSFIPACGPTSCSATGWRTEHQVWASDMDQVKLWDLRNTQQCVAQYHLRGAVIHSLCAVQEGVIAGSQLGSHAMAFEPDGQLRLLQNAQACAPCVSVVAISEAKYGCAWIITTCQPARAGQGCSQHNVGAWTKAQQGAGRTWRPGGCMHEPAVLQSRGAALQLPIANMFCSGDAATGAVKVWGLGWDGGAPGTANPKLAGELPCTQRAACTNVRQVAAARVAGSGAWAVAALRTRTYSTLDPTLTLYSVPA